MDSNLYADYFTFLKTGDFPLALHEKDRSDVKKRFKFKKKTANFYLHVIVIFLFEFLKVYGELTVNYSGIDLSAESVMLTNSPIS